MPPVSGLSCSPADPPRLRALPTAAKVRQVAVGSDPDPLVDVRGGPSFLPAYRRLGLPEAPETLQLRARVIDSLRSAQSLLPAPLELVVLDGWRPRAFQRRLAEYYRDRVPTTAGYVSDPDDQTIVPPHTTGGAVDLTLAVAGVPLALGTDYDDFSIAAHVDTPVEGSDRLLVQCVRDHLYNALLSVGFAPYPLEWWHWSIGDQWWAAYYDHAISRYGEWSIEGGVRA